MTSMKNTKRALFASILSVLLCITMLIGTTFAWFTDSAVSGNNKIVAGNLDVELEYSTDGASWTKVDEDTGMFRALEADGTDNLWEPGHTEVVYLKISNVGTLALTYRLAVTVASETTFENALGDKNCKLSDYLVFASIDGNEQYKTREEAWAAAGDELGLGDYTKTSDLLLPGAAEYAALVVYMPATVGNEANYRGTVIPEIEFGVTLFASQAPYEEDSFDQYYDADVLSETYNVTPENIQEYLDGKHGSMSDAVLILAPGDYGQLKIGVPSAGENGGTVYVCENGAGHSGEALTFTSAEEFNAHYTDNPGWHTTPRYTRTIDNLTLVGQTGVTVSGLSISSGHAYGTSVYDPVKDTTVSGSGYYLTQKISNVTFRNIAFDGNVNIETADDETEIDGVTFEGCSFTTGGTEPSNAAGLRYYNENNNGKVRNLTVKDCTFHFCYQGVYAANVNGVAVTGCEFDTTGHNAIALQSTVHGAVDYKAVKIEGNMFTNIGNRIIRFGEIAADTQLTIKGNTATDSGDDNCEVMRAQSLADGITYDIAGNDWGENTVVANDALKDAQ